MMEGRCCGKRYQVCLNCKAAAYWVIVIAPSSQRCHAVFLSRIFRREWMSSYPHSVHVLWPGVHAVGKNEVGCPWATPVPSQGLPLCALLHVQLGVAHKPSPITSAAASSGNSTEVFPEMALMLWPQVPPPALIGLVEHESPSSALLQKGSLCPLLAIPVI